MKSGDYASTIEGVRFFRRKELEPVARVWEYQVTEGFTVESALKVFTELPEGLEVCFFDPESTEEAYVFIFRMGERLMWRRGGHGWTSQPKEIAIEEAVQYLSGSPLVKRPDSRFESFRVTRQK